MHIPWLPALLLSGSLAGISAAAIPIDQYEDLTFDAPIEHRVRAGDPLHFVGRVEDASITAIQFVFETNTGTEHDFFFLVRPDGRFERDLVFMADQQGSYHVHAFAGALGQATPFKGTFSQVVVDGVSAPVQWPVGFFDGIRLDNPLPTRWPVGRRLPLAGEILDPRVQQLRVNVDTPGSQRSVTLAHDEAHFETQLRLATEDVGEARLEFITSLVDGNFWSRGRISLALTQDPLPQLQVSALSVSLPPGGETTIWVVNAGDGDLTLDAPAIEGPFSIVSVPQMLGPVTRGSIVVRSDGSPGRTGRLILPSNDPHRPRMEVALSSLQNGQAPLGDWQRHTGDIPLVDGEQIVALYSTSRTDEDRLFPYTLGQPESAVAAESTPRAKAVSARYLGEAELRRRESELARRVAAAGGLGAFRTAASQAEIGDQRGFTFNQFGRVPTQRVSATVLAVSQYGVAWGHDGSGAGAAQLPTGRVQEILDQFDADFDLLVASLGAPSDVDGDGKTHFLFTPLVDSTGFGGFVDASSILPIAAGGNGNQTDLIFIRLGEPGVSYRSLLAHEFQHLINFNQHVLVRFGDSEVSWLNEGLSHVAEDLVGGHRVGNAERVATYLADPTTVGLVGDASTSSAKRGGAYLFVRALVDRFGPQVLLGLVGTGRTDRDNLQHVTQEAFEDLLAGFAAQLVTSGTDLGQHPRFDFTFDALAPEGRRGFGPPQMARFEASAGIRGNLPAGGLSFHRVHSQGATTLSLKVDATANLRALVIPVPAGYEIPVVIPADYFRHVTLDASLSATVRSGEAIRIAGRIDPALLPRWEPAAGIRPRVIRRQTCFPHFQSPSMVTALIGTSSSLIHSKANSRWLLSLVGWRGVNTNSNGWVHSHLPACGREQGIVQLPRRYFDRLLIDQSWPTVISPDGAVELGGMVIDRSGGPQFVRIQVDFAGPNDTLSVPMDVVAGRFDGRLALVDQPAGSYSLNVFGQTQEGEFLWLGGSDHIEVRQLPVTAIVESGTAAPTVAQLGDNFPNPFNGHTVIPFHLPAQADATVAIFNVAGQKVAQWQAASLPAGAHRWHWDARSSQGQSLASGVYVVQLQTRDQRIHRKLLLLR